MQKVPFISVEPSVALCWSYDECIKRLCELIGEDKLQQILKFDKIPSPVENEINSEWIKQSKIIGVNPRIVGSYLNIVKYAMTFPEDSIHILPLFEAGNNSCLYAPVNWNLSEEFLDQELIEIGLCSAEDQLLFVINILHALGKKVGFDAVPHTDRFSEIVFVYPKFFEWFKFNDKIFDELSSGKKEIIPYNEDYNYIYKDVEKAIIDYIKLNGDSEGNPVSKDIMNSFFDLGFHAQKRFQILFGKEHSKRLDRRIELMNYIRTLGLNPVPVVDGHPCRPMVVEYIKEGDNRAIKVSVKDREYGYFFGDVTAYKWYEVNLDGTLNTDIPNRDVWDFYSSNLADFQKRFNFDFFRADMAHSQLSHANNKLVKELDGGQEMWATVKERIQENCPYFATLAEAFLVHHYIHPFTDMQNKKFDVILGNLHYTDVDRQNFLWKVKKYNLMGKSFKASITVFTNDCDSKGNNYFFYCSKAKIRAFLALFLNQPSYMGIGFETRDNDPDCYTLDYVHDCSTPYKWGNNSDFFYALRKMRELYSVIRDKLISQAHYWINTPAEGVGCWVYYCRLTKRPSLIFFINTDIDYTKDYVTFDNPFKATGFQYSQEHDCFQSRFELVFSTINETDILYEICNPSSETLYITDLKPGEGRIYKIS